MADLPIPLHYRHLRATPFWTTRTVPQTLLERHCSDAGVYSRISVMQGEVRYRRFIGENAPEAESEVVIEAGHCGIVPPVTWYSIALLAEDTCFNIDYFSEPAKGASRLRTAE